MPEYTVIGQPTARVDGIDKVTGRARYAADFSPPGVLWGKSLHSPVPHARVVSIDTAAARALPGVHAVLTGADVQTGIYGRAIKDIPILAKDVVRFVGERVAAVAADDEDIAQRALDLIEVQYEELPAVFDVEAALAEDAPVLHPDFAGYVGGAAVTGPANGYNHSVTDRGDLAAGFAEADVVIEHAYETKRVHQGYLEPQSVLVSAVGDGADVWTCSKAPYNTREALATAAGIPEENVIFNHTYIGGDFGGKATPAELPIAYSLSKATGRPVLMVQDYVEEFMAANPRHSTVVKLRTGVKNDGTITAHHVQFFVNVGAYAGYKPGRVIGGASQAAGPYRIANTKVESTHVYTNIVPGGHMRAPGYPQGVFALESHIDEIARQLGMDPLAFRLKNLVDDGDEAASGQKVAHIRVKQTLQAAADAADYARTNRTLTGHGFGICEHGPGGGQGTATVTLNRDGTIVLSTPIFDQGTGTYTTLRQVVAEELDIDPARVELKVWPTGILEFDSGIGGSRGSRVATAVANAAVQEVKRSLLKLASSHLEWPEEHLVMQGNEIRRTDADESVQWPQLLKDADTDVTGEAQVDERGPSGVTGYTAQVAEVEVDPETGEYRVTRFITAHDIGRILNPLGHQGQINGGFMQGFGYATMEEMNIDEGRVTNLSFGDYKFPSVRDIPPLETVLLQPDSGIGPYEIKGIGENSTPAVAPAIANAIEDAIGVRIRDLPITAEKIYRALHP
jgi:CO/xanthine dehydrogenase Mo-binding subunit